MCYKAGRCLVLVVQGNSISRICGIWLVHVVQGPGETWYLWYMGCTFAGACGTGHVGTCGTGPGDALYMWYMAATSSI